MSELTDTRPSGRTTLITTILGVLFASPASLVLGLLAEGLLDGNGIAVIFAVPAVLALLIAMFARLRAGIVVLPVLALTSVLGWGLLVLSQAHFE